MGGTSRFDDHVPAAPEAEVVVFLDEYTQEQFDDITQKALALG
jgi:hypothetical protein